MQTVVETPAYLSAAKAASISDETRAAIVSALAANPTMGDLLVGTGGLRKFRFARPNGGKSGGYRILSYYLSDELPAFFIGLFAKNQKGNISASERVEVARRLRSMAESYRRKKRK